MKMLNTIHIVGLGMGPGDIGREAERLVNSSDVLAGAQRHLDFFPEYAGRKMVLADDFSAWLQAIVTVAQNVRVVVLASGDPNFYGLAKRLISLAGAENVRIRPNITTVQAAFARLKETWAGVRVVSLHGRNPEALFTAARECDRMAIFTDNTNTPAQIARLLLDRGQADWRMCVLEDLGDPDSKVSFHRLSDAAGKSFSPLNMVVLWLKDRPKELTLGEPDDSFVHQAGLITKAEVRAVALSKLKLGRPDQVLWDLGAGCGSVGIEATLLMPGGKVFAVEKEAERVEHIRRNRSRFGIANMEILHGGLPDAIDGLPDPDRVFIGGGGDALGDTIKKTVSRLAPGGVVVISAVKLDSQETARKTLIDAGLEVEAVQVQVSRGAPLGGDLFMKALNPVWLFCGHKPVD